MINNSKKETQAWILKDHGDDVYDMLVAGVNIDSGNDWVARKTSVMISECQESYSECLGRLDKFSSYKEFKEHTAEDKWKAVTSKAYVRENFSLIPREREFEEAEADSKALGHYLARLDEHTAAFKAGKLYCVKQEFENDYESNFRYFETLRDMANFLAQQVNVKIERGGKER